MQQWNKTKTMFNWQIPFHCRNKIYRTERILHQNWSIGGEIEQNYGFCDSKCGSAELYLTQSVSLLFHLFHHEFGGSCFSIGNATMVRWCHQKQYEAGLARLFERKILFHSLHDWRYPFDWKNDFSLGDLLVSCSINFKFNATLHF